MRFHGRILRKSSYPAFCLWLALFSCSAVSVATRGPDVWITSADRAKLFERGEVSVAERGPAQIGSLIQVDATKKFQEMEGFGAAMTGSSAYVINRLNPRAKEALLEELFDPEDGIGISYLRMSIGASDFSLSPASYNDMPPGKTDHELEGFSIDREKADLIPVLKEVYRIFPRMSLVGSPWSAPGWMKDSGVMEGGTLLPEAYPAFAKYFVKYIRAFADEGIPVKAITIQNEPQHEAKYASMGMTAEEQRTFIKDHLGPLLAREKLSTEILSFDHNWSTPEYPLDVLNDPEAKKYIAGSAFHCYEGEVSAMSRVHEAHPDKGIYFTECSNGLWYQGGWGESFSDISKMIIGIANHWGKNVLMWNLALDENHGPTTNPPPGPGQDGNYGCMECTGFVTVHSRTGEITRNSDYYAFAHFSKFVRPGARRILSSSNDEALHTVVFENADGRKAAVVFNDGEEERNVTVQEAGRSFAFILPSRSLATAVWR